MKINIDKAFEEIVENASKFAVTGKAAQTPAYSCVKVEIKNGTATAYAANGHAFYAASAKGYGLLDGTFTVDARLFSGALERFIGGTVEDTGAKLIFKKGRQTFSLALPSVDGNLELPETMEEKSVTLETGLVLAALNTVSYAMGSAEQAETNPTVEAVRITSKNGKLRFDAVDGYRVARVSIPSEETGVDILLPAWVVRQILSDELVKNSKEVRIFSEHRHNGIVTGTVRIVSNALAGAAFDADAVFTAYPNLAVCSTADLKAVMKTSRLVQETANIKLPVILEILPREKKIDVSLRGNTAAISDEIAVEDGKGSESVRIGINAAYLNDAVQHLASEKTAIAYSSSLAPIQMMPVGSKNGVEIIHIILPVHLDK